MEFKEINILNLAILEVLNEREHRALKLLLVSEENYQNFLRKFLQVIIGRDNTVSLEQFLELHNLSNKLGEFQSKTIEILEEIAELVFRGYTSENTQWLLQSKNEVITRHLAFLQETKSGVLKIERDALKKRLADIDKVNALELTDQEIKTGIKILERKRLKSKFNELNAKLKQSHNDNQRSAPRKLKYSTIFVLLIVSGFIFAVSIPKVRNYIIKQLQEIFNKKITENNPSTGSKVNSPSLQADSLRLQGNGRDSLDLVAKSLQSKNSKDSALVKTAKTYKLYRAYGVKNVNLKAYEKHFIIHKNEIDSIEGVWELNGKFKKYSNPIKTRCAIREIENNKFEMVFFDDAGNKWSLRIKYFLLKTDNPSKYDLLEYVNNELISKKSLVFKKKDALRFQVDMFLSEFNVVIKNSDERVPCTYIGRKKRLK